MLKLALFLIAFIFAPALIAFSAVECGHPAPSSTPVSADRPVLLEVSRSRPFRTERDDPGPAPTAPAPTPPADVRPPAARSHPPAPRPARSAAAVLACIRAGESHGNYRAVSPGGKYRGAYQFDASTWASVGGTGDPASASPGEQDARAALLLTRRGLAPWPRRGSCGR